MCYYFLYYYLIKNCVALQSLKQLTEMKIHTGSRDN